MRTILIRSGIAVAAAYWGARQLSGLAKDVARYNAMRAMSGDPGLSLGQVRAALYPSTATKPTNAPAYGEDAKAPAFIQFLASIPADIARYLKLSSM